MLLIPGALAGCLSITCSYPPVLQPALFPASAPLFSHSQFSLVSQASPSVFDPEIRIHHLLTQGSKVHPEFNSWRQPQDLSESSNLNRQSPLYSLQQALVLPCCKGASLLHSTLHHLSYCPNLTSLLLCCRLRVPGYISTHSL